MRIAWFLVTTASFFCSIYWFPPEHIVLGTIWLLGSLTGVLATSLSRHPEKDEGH